jgi:hypothetical protein
LASTLLREARIESRGAEQLARLHRRISFQRAATEGWSS